MADFELNIATEQFKQVGFEHNFDHKKYGELVGIFAAKAETYKKPTVYLAPWAPLLARTKVGAIAMVLLNRKHRQFGLYEEETAGIYVYSNGDAEDANKTLVHETKHWGDDIAGLLPSKRETRKETLKRMAPWAGGALVLDAIVQAATYEITQSESAAQWALIASGVLTTMGLISVKHRVAYENFEWEQRARDFADDPAVLAQFGKIISA